MNRQTRITQTGIGYDHDAPVPVQYPEFDETPETQPKMQSWDFARELCFILNLWDQHAFGEGDEFMAKLLQLRDDSPAGRDFLVRNFATGFEDLGKSYSQRGAAVLHSKQNMHQNEKRMIRSLEIHFPELAELIKSKFKKS